MISRIGYYMKAFELSGKKIAQVVHVDPSLVSKWKNGDRLLHTESIEAKLLSQYLLFKDAEKEKSYFRRCFMEQEDLLQLYDAADQEQKQWMITQLICEEGQFPFLKPNLKKYTTYDQAKMDTQIASESRKMMISFLEKVQNMKSSQLIIFLSGQESWLVDFLSDEDIILLLLEASKQRKLVMNLGFMNENNHSYNELKCLKALLPMYMGDAFEVRIGYVKNQGNHWYMVASGIGILQGISLKDQKFPKGFTQLIQDEYLVDFYSKFIMNESESYQQIGTKYNRYKLQEVLKLVQENGGKKDQSYFVSSQLFFTSMSKDLLNEIMEDNEFTTTQKLMTSNLYDKLNFNFETNVSVFKNRHLYSYDALERLTENDKFIYDHLSLIANKTVYMSRKQFIRHLEDTIKRYQTYENHQLFLVREKVFHNILKLEHMWIKDSNIVMMWFPELIFETVVIQQEAIIWQLVKEIEEVWESNEILFTEGSLHVRQLEKLIRLAKSS